MARACLVALLISLAAASAGVASPRAQFAALLDDYWRAWLARNPTEATALGERAFDDRLADLSVAAIDRASTEAQGFLARTNAIGVAALSAEERTSARILRRLLEEEVAWGRHPARYRLFTHREGFHTAFATWPERAPFFTARDFESYVARLEAFPAQVDQAIATTRASVKAGWALPCATLAGLPQSVRQVAEPPERSRFLKPLARRPAAVSERRWDDLRRRATQAVERGVNPAYLRFAHFLEREYLPACRKEDGVGALPGGRAFYAFRVAAETTTDLTPQDIHRLGLAEVARIRDEMEQVARRAGFPDRAAYVAHLRADPRYYARTPEELMRHAAYWAKFADGWMPRLFGRLPRLPYGLAQIPAETAPGTTTAYYQPGAPAAGRAGVYFVNTSKLNERPLFELPALTLHEAVPGHHHQIALQQELDLPPFRRHAAFFTAFVEGWGLYAEHLGLEMGAYAEPAADMGRLSYEMWRACRLVVDTGLHALGWSRQQAIDFMLENTALSRANVEAEVNRYMAWPGQALAYKVGELKIRALRAEAERALGEAFDLRAFHDALLGQGALPLDLMEEEMRAWIAARQQALAAMPR